MLLCLLNLIQPYVSIIFLFICRWIVNRNGTSAQKKKEKKKEMLNIKFIFWMMAWAEIILFSISANEFLLN